MYEKRPRSTHSENSIVVGDVLDCAEWLKAHYGKQSVSLIYIDPPFNTQKTFQSYADRLSHEEWLSMFKDRLVATAPLLKNDGSVWVHLDDSELHHARFVLDEIFGEKAYVGSIIWEKRTSRESRSALSSAHDTILIYSPAGPQKWKLKRNLIPRRQDQLKNPDNDPRGSWADAPFTAPGYRDGQQYPIVTPTGERKLPPKGRSWYTAEDRFHELMQDNRIWFPKNGNGSPRLKRFSWELKGLVPKTLWFADEVGTTESAKRKLIKTFHTEIPFDTPKPVELLERIVQIATDEGDIVMDFFAGSGTTMEAAARHRRNWIVVERSFETTRDFITPRFQNLQSELPSVDLSNLIQAFPRYGEAQPISALDLLTAHP
ncbi:site-specific DNA-methyltransferase [Corynebacterium coyleae]|uniref:Site-specific DNA-methyltransferase n=1 Tax=Corynebacterium coyleae TaxID=53374 RepID=A0ABX8KTG9_9CORY|nr:site-specific DNA-methyltransferase [Corynebacterium coyleae]QXB17757.1 site-specific DNA-methyltransferase [Corynebacterium coyleae]WJY79163.1 Modification methylase MboII [Corynebacterium coyleae]